MNVIDSESDRQNKLRAILEELTDEEQRLFSAVLKVEQQKLHMERPRHIQDDLWKVISETIR